MSGNEGCGTKTSGKTGKQTQKREKRRVCWLLCFGEAWRVARVICETRWAESDALLERGSMTFIQSLYHRHTTTNGRLEGQVHRTDALGLLERWDLVLTAFCGRGLPRDAMSSRRCLELTARCSSAGKAAVGKQPASVARSDRYTKKERNSRAGRVIKERNWAGKDEERKERNLEAEKIAESPNPCRAPAAKNLFSARGPSTGGLRA
jgi:hypothetical protein